MVWINFVLVYVGDEVPPDRLPLLKIWIARSLCLFVVFESIALNFFCEFVMFRVLFDWDVGGTSLTFGVAYPVVYIFVTFLASGVEHWVFDVFVPDCRDNDFEIKVPIAFEVMWLVFVVD